MDAISAIVFLGRYVFKDVMNEPSEKHSIPADCRLIAGTMSPHDAVILDYLRMSLDMLGTSQPERSKPPEAFLLHQRNCPKEYYDLLRTIITKA